MQKQIDAEVDGGTLAKDATIEWGGAGMGAGEPPPEEGGAEQPPAQGTPNPMPNPNPTPNGNGQQPPNEEKQLLTSEKDFDINKIQRLLKGVSNGS